MSVIELKDVSVTFHEGGRTVEAVKHVTLNVDKGEIFGIVGFSGAGKSTLVRTINLLERPTGGQVVIDGNDITGLRGADLRGLRKKIGFIFQGFNLIGNVTVGKNIESRLKRADIRSRNGRSASANCLRSSDWKTRSTAIRPASQVGRSNVYRLPVRLPTSRRSSCATRPPARWILKPRKAFWRYCNASIASLASPSYSSRINWMWPSRSSIAWP